MSIAENVALARERIAAAAIAAGRRPEEITLVAATKMNDAARVQEAIAAGIGVCGENRVQELLEKRAQGAYAGAQLHFIGHLQKNKAKQIVGAVDLIQSADSPELLRLISRLAQERGLCQELLLEINIGRESAKSGLMAEALPETLALCGSLPAIRVRGLMTIPPICASSEESFAFFRQMQQLFVDNRPKKYDNVHMDFLSMGMSGDYEAAIACGANMVRLGTALFGPRPYHSLP